MNKVSGRDAAEITPKLVPDDELLPRDDSGGPDWEPYNMQFGDGGRVTGAKTHLSASGGGDDPRGSGNEISRRPRETKGKIGG
jgi:hypothetical protein